MVDPRAILLRSAGPNASLFTNETMEEKQEEDEQEEKVAFVPTLSEPRRDLPLFHVSPRLSLSLSRPFSAFLFVSPSFLPHLSLLPLPRPTLGYPLPRLMPFVSWKRD